MDHLNAEQVLALAPDAASAEAGQNLSSPARWSTLGRADHLIWGESQGSGLSSEPCRTQAELTGTAFHCSCRSRKMPCKHVLGLLLLVAVNPARVPESAPPPWVQTRAAKPRSARKREVPATGDATAGRTAALEEAQAFLSELIAEGLARARLQPAAYFEQMAARSTEAKTPGLARRLRTWPALFAGDDDEEWASRALEEAGSLQLLLNSAARLDDLPANTRVSVCTALGWPLDEKNLLTGATGVETVTDTWVAVGRRFEPVGDARVRRTWLLGRKTGRTALCSSPAEERRSLDAAFVPGAVFEADLAFYPGAMALRATVQARRGGEEASATGPTAAAPDLPPAHANFTESLDGSTALLAADPWLEPTPWFVEGCVPAVRHHKNDDGRVDEHWTLRDRTDAVVPLTAHFPGVWQLLAASGGAPVTVFGEWDGHALLPLSAVAAGRFIDLAPAAGASSNP